LPGKIFPFDLEIPPAEKFSAGCSLFSRKKIQQTLNKM